MAWKDPYAILGVGRGAPLSEVKRAYRKLAFSVHPDVGDNPDEARFREAREAYEALIETEQRRPCRINVVEVPRRAGTMRVDPLAASEPIRQKSPVNVIDDFATVRPSVGEILDYIAQNFFGFHQKAVAHAGTWVSRSSWTGLRPSSACVSRSRFRCTRYATDAR